MLFNLWKPENENGNYWRWITWFEFNNLSNHWLSYLFIYEIWFTCISSSHYLTFFIVRGHAICLSREENLFPRTLPRVRTGDFYTAIGSPVDSRPGLLQAIYCPLPFPPPLHIPSSPLPLISPYFLHLRIAFHTPFLPPSLPLLLSHGNFHDCERGVHCRTAIRMMLMSMRCQRWLRSF